jgi:hypothetical protein
LRQLDPERIERDRAVIQVLNVALPIALSIAGGLLFHAIRRRRYRTAA